MSHNITGSEPACIIVLNQQELDVLRSTLKVICCFLTALTGHRTGAKNFIAVFLILIEFPMHLVVDLSGVGKSTAYKLRNKVRDGLSEEVLAHIVCSRWHRGRPSKLTAEQKQDVYDRVDKKNFFSLRQIADYIYETHGSKLALSTVHELLRKDGIKKYKCGSLPAKADADKQREFYDSTLEPLIKRSKENSIKLYFMDAAHFVIGNDFIASIYGHSRRFCRTFSGRKRYNVLGAIEFSSKAIMTVTNEEYITATEVAEMLNKLSEASNGLPVYVVLDNARYQKCNLVTERAKELNISLVYLPSYSPNLNVIERLWKYTKNELRQHYYEDFFEFKSRIDQILEDAQTINRSKLESLIGENLWFFDDCSYIDGNTFELGRKKTG